MRDNKNTRKPPIHIVFLLWLVLSSALISAGIAVAAAADNPLSAAERAWLRENSPLTFVSQTTYPPFEFLDEQGMPQGMCIELIQWMATELGFKALFRNMAFHEAQQAVLTGQADVVTSLFYSQKRNRDFDFTEMTWKVPALIFVRAERPDITGLQSLQGKRIAMQRGDYAAEFLGANGVDYTVVPATSFADAANDLIDGKADALIGDQQIVLYHLFSNNLVDRLKSVGKPLYTGRNCMGARKGRSELVGILDKGLELAREQGVLQRITRKWVGTHYPSAPFWRQRYVWFLVVALAAVAGFAAIVVVWGIRLKGMVTRRTRELIEARDATRPIASSVSVTTNMKWWLSMALLLIPLCIGADYLLRNVVIMPSYLSLEKREAEKAVGACVDALKREIHHLGQIARDWATWDDTYRFMQNGNQAYVQSNFQWESLLGSDIHLIYLYDINKKLVLGEACDPVSHKKILLNAFSHQQMLDSQVSGIVLTRYGPMLTVSSPILSSAGTGPTQGFLVMGRFLLEETVRTLALQTRVRFNVKNPKTMIFTQREDALLDRLSQESIAIEPVGADLLMAYASIPDLDGNPALLIAATLPREIVQRGKVVARIISAVTVGLVATIAICIVVWAATYLTEMLRRQTHVEALVEQRTAALLESQTKFKELADLLPQTVFETDARGRLTYVNRQGVESFGYTDDDLVAGVYALEMLAQQDRSRAEENIGRIMNGTTVPAEEYNLLRKDGTSFPAIIYAGSIQRKGITQGIRGIVADMTEWVRLVDQQNKLKAQFQQVQKVEALGRLASGVAHDLNNLLSPILGYAELLLDRVGANQPERRQIEPIIQASLSARDLVKQLLAFSRRQTLTYKWVDLNEVISKFLNLLRHTIRENIEIETVSTLEIGLVQADVGQIEQVIMNLVVNAQDAMPEGGKLTIETHRVRLDDAYASIHIGTEPGDYVLLAISDTGQGMDEEIRQHIFEPFFSTKGELGTGLGLATVYGIVKQHGGNVWIYSEEGKGTTFKIYLPVAENEQLSNRGENKMAADMSGSETILLVEDNQNVRDLVNAILARLGYAVLTAQSSVDALDVLDNYEKTIHLMLTDVIMPGLSGRELFNRAVEKRPGLKVLYMSGYTEKVVSQHGVLEKEMHFIQKPFSIETIAMKIKEVLKEVES